MEKEQKQARLEEVLSYQNEKLKHSEVLELNNCEIELLRLNVFKENFEDFAQCEDKWENMEFTDNSIDFLKKTFASLRNIIDEMYPGEYYPVYEEEVFLNRLRLGQTVQDMYNIYRVKTDNDKCPYCGCSIFGHDYSISRRDNSTKICPDCGLREALEDVTDTRL